MKHLTLNKEKKKFYVKISFNSNYLLYYGYKFYDSNNNLEFFSSIGIIKNIFNFKRN